MGVTYKITLYTNRVKRNLVKQIKEWILNNKLVQLLFKAKFYIDISFAQAGWFTGKLPELMAILYLAERFNIIIPNNIILIVLVVVVALLLLFGWLFKQSGLYDAEVYVQSFKNPVQEELLLAARKINLGVDKVTPEYEDLKFKSSHKKK